MVYDEVKEAHQDEKKIEICLKAAGVKSDEAAERSADNWATNRRVPGHTNIRFLAEWCASRD